MPEHGGRHLRTQFVFIDTQAFRRARVDWSGRSLSRLVELAQQGQLRLIVTGVTTREVRSQLRELLAEANASLSKHRGLLQQLGVSSTIERVRDQSTALGTLEAAFDQFLQDTRAINIPLISDLTAVLDDYFAQRPPFSTKKKSEFPDAISIASVRLWCQQNRATAYIVSEDRDLQACCSESGPLFHAESINDIISRATVSQDLHDALEKALNGSEYLRDTLIEKIKESATVETSSSSPGDWQVTTAEIDGVPSVRTQRLAAWFGAFEEPPRMSSERDACLRKADEAKQRAAQATEPSIKSAYEKVAEHWMLLARLESLVAADSEDA